MNFSCEQCGRKYSIADERVGDKGVRIRCKHCQHVIVVKPPPSLPAEESTRMVSLEELERGGVAAPRTSPGGARPAARGGAGGKGQRTEVAPAPAPDAPDVTNPGTSSPWEGEATRAVVAPDPNAQWFAMVKGQQVGPFDMRGLSGKVKAGEVNLKTFVWREGMGDWTRAEELPELALMFAGGAAKEEPRPAPVKADAVKSIAAALQKSAAVGARGPAREPARPGEPVVEPRRAPVAEASPDEMWPGEPAGNGVEAPAPEGFDLSLDAPDGVDAPNQGLDLDLDLDLAPGTPAAPAADEPFAPAAPAPAMSSQAAVTVSPHPPRRGGARKPAPSRIDTPPPADDPPPEPATTADPSGPSASASLSSSDLFSDLDLRRSGEHARPLDAGDLTRTADEPAPGGADADPGDPADLENEADQADPFAKMGKIPVSMLPKPGEATGHVISQAGVRKRNPLWKIALVAVLLPGLPVGVLYALSALDVMPLQVTHVDQATGETVTDPVFSARGVSGLRDLLLGKKRAAPRETKPRVPADPGAGPAGKVGGGGEPGGQQLAELYRDGQKKDVGPEAAPPDPAAGDPKEEPVGGPPHEEINKVVEATQRAFQFCIEQELKKNPGFKGGKVKLVATVGASGVVKKASIDRKDIDGSELGECLKGKARRMSFSAFSGEDVDLEIPLILSAAM